MCIITQPENLIIRVYLLNKTHASILFVRTHTCVWEGVTPVSLSTDHTLHLHVGVCRWHPRSLPCPLPTPVCKDTRHNVAASVGVCVCACLLFCSLFCDNRMLSPAYLLFHIAILWGISRASQRRVTWRKGLLSNQTPTTPEHHQPKTPLQACNQISILMRL